MNEEASLSSLLCEESSSGLKEDAFCEKGPFDDNDDEEEEEDDEYMEMLFGRETCSFGLRDNDVVQGSWIERARLDSITWILKSCAVCGFEYRTAYLSMTYFDRFLARRFIVSEKSWAVRLLSMACLSLAAKMEEMTVTSLYESRTEEYCFDRKAIQRMELFVLSALDWKMIAITPFVFIRFLVRKFCTSPPSGIVSRIAEFILGIMKDINLLDHRPSSIAAAATLAALNDTLTKSALEDQIKDSSLCRSLDIDAVFACYTQMQRLDPENLETIKRIVPPDICLCNSRPVRLLDGSSLTSATGTKRKNFEFNHHEDDQSFEQSEKHRKTSF